MSEVWSPRSFLVKMSNNLSSRYTSITSSIDSTRSSAQLRQLVTFESFPEYSSTWTRWRPLAISTRGRSSLRPNSRFSSNNSSPPGNSRQRSLVNHANAITPQTPQSSITWHPVMLLGAQQLILLCSICLTVVLTTTLLSTAVSLLVILLLFRK